MEASRGKGLSTRAPAASRIAAVGKENICPALSSIAASRSPLPDGFPRAPLQDITHILGPINILPDDAGEDVAELGECRRGLKRSKCVVGAQTSRCITRSESELVASEAWRGLKKCATLQAVNSDAHVTGESKLTNSIKSENFTHLSERTKITEEAKLTDSVEIEKPLLSRERRDTEVLEELAAEALCLVKPTKSKLKRSVRLGASSPATRASLRSSQENQKMSSLMKFR